jgi:hypothetical protein
LRIAERDAGSYGAGATGRLAEIVHVRPTRSGDGSALEHAVDEARHDIQRTSATSSRRFR